MTNPRDWDERGKLVLVGGALLVELGEDTCEVQRVEDSEGRPVLKPGGGVEVCALGRGN